MEDAVKGLDLQLERYTREILELDEVKPKKTDRDYAEVAAFHFACQAASQTLE